MKLTGTISLDAGVHNADILQYYFGEAASAFGQVRLFERKRVRRNTEGPGGFYARWAANMPDSIEPTGEDAMRSKPDTAPTDPVPSIDEPPFVAA